MKKDNEQEVILDIVKVKKDQKTGELITITTQDVIDNNNALIQKALQVNTGVLTGINVAEEIKAQQALSNFIKNVFVPGKHYGTLPNTKSKALFQPGADLLENVFKKFFENARTRYEIVEKELLFDMQYISYEYKCILSVNGNDIAEAVAGCNSLEASRRLVFQDYKKDTDEWVNKSGKSVFDVKDTVNQMAQKRAHNRLWRKVFAITAEFTDESVAEQLDGTNATRDDKGLVYQELYVYDTGDKTLGSSKEKRREFLKKEVLTLIMKKLEITNKFQQWKKDEVDKLRDFIAIEENVKPLIEEALNANKK